MIIISEDEWVETYRPLPAPIPGSGFDFGSGCTLIDGHRPLETQALIAADDACVWTVVDGDEGTAIVAGRHLVNRIGYIITEVPRADDDIEIVMDD